MTRTQTNPFGFEEPPKRLTEEEIAAQARVEADDLGLQNQAKVEMINEDQSRRASGQTNYGQSIDPAVQRSMDLNRTQRDTEIAGSLSRRDGESAVTHMDRLALDPNADLNRAYMEEKTFRATERYSPREKAYREYLAMGAVAGSQNPSLQRMASEFAMEFPGEAKRIRGELRGEAPRETIPFDQERLDRIEADSAARPERKGSEQGMGRFDNLPEDEQRKYLEAAGMYVLADDPDDPSLRRAAAELHHKQLRRERGLDRESRQLRRSEVSRSNAIRAITGRHGNDPSSIRRAITNYNSRNPNNPLVPEDFGLNSAGENVTARPGEVVEVNDVRSVNPRNVASGSILTDASGSNRVARRKDGSTYGQPVLQDQRSGFHFPDPDRYGDQSQFDGAMSRQDRVNMRQAIMQSGNSPMAAEQRRLSVAREAANSSIPEIREAGIKEVNDLERSLHYRYATEAANLMGPAATGGREEVELGRATNKPETAKAEKPITVQDVRDYVAEIMTPAMGADRDLQAKYRGMTPEQREEDAYRRMQEGRQPYGASAPAATAVSDTPAAAPAASAATATTTFSPVFAGMPDSFPDKSDTQAWFKVLTESYGPVLDRNVDLIRELPPGERKAAMQVLISEFEAFGMNRDEAPDGDLSAMFKAYRRAMSALEGSQ